MPGLVVPGVLLLGLGLALTAWVVLRARILAVPLSLSLLATALLLPFANEQTSRVLLAVPFGVPGWRPAYCCWHERRGPGRPGRSDRRAAPTTPA